MSSRSSRSSICRKARTTTAGSSPCSPCSGTEAGAAFAGPASMLSVTAAVAERVALLARQVAELTVLGDVLNPAVVDERDRQHALAAHAGVAGHDVVGLRALAGSQEHPAHDCGVGGTA